MTTASLRGLAAFLAAAMVVQGLIVGALAPLLPSFEASLDLSKGQAGVLVGMFPLGQAVAALPVGLLASRVGVRRFALAGLALFAVASAAFGFADTYLELLGTRFLHGLAGGILFASGLAWLAGAAPRERRGEMIGVITAGAALGQVLGPAVGGLAALGGRAGVFAAVAGVAALLAVIGSRRPGLEVNERQSFALLRRVHRSRTVLAGHWLVALPGLLLGAMFVLGPLQLHRVGWGPLGIAGTFLAAASVGVVARPAIGRWADRCGMVNGLRVLILIAIPLTLVIPWVETRWLLSVLVACAVATYGVLFGPAMAFLSQAYESAMVAPLLGFALMTLTSGVGIFIGSAVGGGIANVAGDATADALAAGLCLATVVALSRGRRSRLPKPAPAVRRASRFDDRDRVV